jgi:hypothetical protein
MKSILIFFDLHISLLNFLSKHVTVERLSKGQKIKVSLQLDDLEYIYVYDGAISFKFEDKYAIKKPHLNCSSNRIHLIKGESFDPLHKAHFFGDDFPDASNIKINEIVAAKVNTIYLKMDNYFIRNLFDNKKHHQVLFAARHFDEVIKDVMCGFNGTNSVSRALVNESFIFQILHPNELLIEEGQSESQFLFVILSGKIDLRRNLNAKKK